MTMRGRVAALVLGLLVAGSSFAAGKPQAPRFGRFGTLHVYPGAQPARTSAVSSDSSSSVYPHSNAVLLDPVSETESATNGAPVEEKCAAFPSASV